MKNIQNPVSKNSEPHDHYLNNMEKNLIKEAEAIDNYFETHPNARNITHWNTFSNAIFIGGNLNYWNELDIQTLQLTIKIGNYLIQ